MNRALFIVDLQNDFTEGGALGVDGGDEVATRVTRHLQQHGSDYQIIVASRDWHDLLGDNGGHFATSPNAPDYVNTWPVHCVAGTTGAEYDPLFDTSRVTHHLYKGQGKPDYSLFQGVTATGETAADLLALHRIERVDVVGIATDYCMRASALDALAEGVEATVLTELVAGVAVPSSQAAIDELRAAGATIH